MRKNNKELEILKSQMLEDLKDKYVEINMMREFDDFAGLLMDIYAKNYALVKYGVEDE